MKRCLQTFAALLLGAHGLAAFGAAPPTAPVAPSGSPPASFEPKYYGCRGTGITAVYKVTSPDGQGVLSLKLFGKSYEFKNEQITSVSTALGDIKEVFLEIKPDVSSTTASLILPRINLVQKSALMFQTQFAVTKNSMPSVRIPPDGVANVSTYYPVFCVARKEADASTKETLPENPAP
jgi:hypothetical protein